MEGTIIMNKYRCSCGAFKRPGMPCKRCMSSNHTDNYLDYYNMYNPGGGMGDVSHCADFQFVGAPIPDIPDSPPDAPIDWSFGIPNIDQIGRIGAAIGTGIIDVVIPGFGVAADIARIMAETTPEGGTT